MSLPLDANRTSQPSPGLIRLWLRLPKGKERNELP